MIYCEKTDNWLLEDIPTYNPFSVLTDEDTVISIEDEEANPGGVKFLTKVSKKRKKNKTRKAQKFMGKVSTRDQEGSTPAVEVYRCRKCFYSHCPMN